ncbi:FMN-dependent dehydrogenase [Aspergillus pseudoustus]|uniref:FMN-dependent dehydrogenase n=1 Tax=Aspergillus pseudoustus TaxID=1810923 RepID=A0ABR4JKG0_9EURO
MGEGKPESATPTPFTYENEIYAAGLSDQRPQISFDATKWESLARERLPADSFGYVWGSAGTRETDENNRAAFRKWGIVPSRLVEADFPSLKTRLFGEEYDYPIALAPVGVQRIFHREGEIAVARAAAQAGVTYTLSTAASASIEDVARANDTGGDNGDGSRWYQLYWPSNEHNDITASLLNDLDHGYNPFLIPDNIGVEIGFSDPVFQRHFQEKHGISIEEDVLTAAREWARIMFPGKSHGWRDIQFLREHWDGPIVLKGIHSVSDAKKARDAGVQGIVVSNHGGRQQDGGVGSLDVLPEIVDELGNDVEVIFDSGVRCGADVVKALALGAKMVLLGRPYVYGLAIAGEQGVRHVLRSILGDLQLTLHLSGIPDVNRENLNSSVLRRTSG